MYGRTINAQLPYLGTFEPSPYIETSNLFGEVDDKALDLVQDAYLCCADQLPKSGSMGDIWICNICDRIWAIPSRNKSWTLTKLVLVEPHEKQILALRSYRWWLGTLVSVALTLLTMFVTFVVVIGVDAPHAVYISFGIGAVGTLITYIVIRRWRKLLREYNFSLSE